MASARNQRHQTGESRDTDIAAGPSGQLGNAPKLAVLQVRIDLAVPGRGGIGAPNGVRHRLAGLVQRLLLVPEVLIGGRAPAFSRFVMIRPIQSARPHSGDTASAPVGGRRVVNNDSDIYPITRETLGPCFSSSPGFS
jgi:hypothetical protein